MLHTKANFDTPIFADHSARIAAPPLDSRLRNIALPPLLRLRAH